MQLLRGTSRELGVVVSDVDVVCNLTDTRLRHETVIQSGCFNRSCQHAVHHEVRVATDRTGEVRVDLAGETVVAVGFASDASSGEVLGR